MKYVIVEQRELELPILCNDILNHSDVVPQFAKVVSAGFVSLGDNNQISCWGHSVSLKTVSRGTEDEKLIRKSFGLDRGW